MNEFDISQINDKWILSKRGEKNTVDFLKPYGYFVEKERTSSGTIDDVATILLTNSECPFRCLMCDLWKNTTDKPVPENSIPAQIEFALSKLPKTKHLKLYNSGSFFDTRAIPETDYKNIAGLINNFETVIVESHPSFINEKVLYFNDLIQPKLQVAIGLETVHPEILPLLNKKMTLADFEKSVRFLNHNNIESRAFILLRPPFLSEEEGLFWAKKSIDFAFNAGINSCTIIPVRAGNGAMEILSETGNYEQPNIKSLESVIEYGMQINAGSVFADLWDIEMFSQCPICFEERKNRLTQMNLNQKIHPQVLCTCDTKFRN